MPRRHSSNKRSRNEPSDGQSGSAAMTDSPSQRYRSFSLRRDYERTSAARFARLLPFELDDFQIQANTALEEGQNVLVAAPTGAGKTVIADFAVFLAQENNVKAFYTTPIKALSNQKYHDLCAVYGSDRVGLLTGDTSINAHADIIVMTTEVLRNMLYEHSSDLHALRYVILDEVHYLADRFRGPVWEEVIIHLPRNVRIVGLSATVSNVEDFSQWISSVRGKTRLVVSEKRPVPLEQHVLVQRDEHSEPEIIDLYQRGSDGGQSATLNAGLIHRLDQLDHVAARIHGPQGRRGRGHRDERGHQPQRHTPRRWAVVDELNYLGMLPGIYFIFSRNGCDQAVEQCITMGLELTTDEEVTRIRGIVDSMIEGQLSHEDLKALHFSRFRFALEEGFAAHHAGMISLFRQIVERLFEEGLVKMVFATETLALGINMPARCVVVEKLEKFDGTGHVALTPGEFTQLTGRAGRRGIDTIGHAVVVDHRGFLPATAAALSSKRVYPLHSSFKPTFNMAVNLLHSNSYETARDTLDHSFAQWEANESAWQLESRIRTLDEAVHGYEQAFHCEHGDFKELMTIRLQLSELQKDARRELKHKAFQSQAERTRAFRELDRRIADLRERDRDHPCRRCPDLALHLTWGHRWIREQRELDRARDRYDSRTGSVARQFDSICDILDSLGYLIRSDGAARDYRLTERGELLRHLYSEQDLVLAQSLASHQFDDLGAAQLACVLSGLVYQSRHGSGGEPRYYPGGPRGPIAQAVARMRAIASTIGALREDHGLDPLEPLDFSAVDIIYEWAEGASLGSVLKDTELTGGDFVRSAKRLADVLQQVASAKNYLGSNPSLAATAHTAQTLINRGVVAYSGVD